MHTRAARLLLLALVTAPLCAQNLSGSLRGIVQDATAARIAGAGVAVQPSGSSATRRVTSDESGEFLVGDLPPGSYHVAIVARGFAMASADVTISLGSTRDLTITLRPRAVEEAIGVQAAGSSSIAMQPLDHASSVHGSVITREDLDTLPLSARAFANIAFLAPGTMPVEPSDPTKARITAVSTGGSSGLNNELSVDGGDNSDDFIGGFLQNLSPDVIGEFAVRTAQEDADTGNTTAGSVVITTRSGTDQLHGTEAFLERATALNARFPIENPEPNPKQPFSRQNYVATFGGPVKREKLWFFAGFEHVHEDASIAYSPASVAQFSALASLAAQGLIPGVNTIPTPGFVPIPFRDFMGSLRGDWRASERSQWFLRSSVDTYTIHNDLVQQGALPSSGLLAHNSYLTTVVGNEYSFSPTLRGRLVVNGSGLHLTQVRNSDLGFALAFPFSATALTVSGFETFGDNQFATPITFFPSGRSQEKYQLRYDVSETRGGHVLKMGVNLIHEPVLEGSFPDNTETLYKFPQDPLAYLNNPNQFTADMMSGASISHLGGKFSQNIQRYGAYVEDSWRVRPGLTVNGGARYSTTSGLFTGSGQTQAVNPGMLTLEALDIVLVPGVPHDDHKQLAPRLGLAYSPGSGGKTVLRGGFGLFFSDLAQNGWATALEALGVPSGSCTDPVQNPGGAENAGCAAGGASASLIDAHYKTPYAMHVTTGIQRAIGRNWAVTADYVHEEGITDTGRTTTWAERTCLHRSYQRLILGRGATFRM